MTYDAHLWHISDREKNSEWEALFIHALLEWSKTRTGRKYRTILDASCGNGRLHPFLRNYGYDVFGFDFSEELVEEAVRRGNNCWKGDLRDPDAYRGKYDVIISWFTSFGYFSHEKNVKVLRLFRNSLNEGGVLLLDVPNFDYLKNKDESWMFASRYGDIIEIEEGWREEKDYGFVNHSLFRHFRDEGNRLVLHRKLDIDITIYKTDVLIGMLKDAGFREVYTFETMRTSPPGEKSRRITFVAVG